MHRPRNPAPAAGASLFRSGAGTRLLAAAILSALVWLAIAWALAA